ncbi:MAG: anaerobic ribonucleoside-triphosphate reductase activating protein [Clostridia bacterium]|nr:anaerobic ribonucleoside-triphosphate reductase activating protein [Clostridia bacterium]
MVIAGLQKLTLLDYPGKVACTVFTGGCNLRCSFCHNAGLVTGDIPFEDGEEVFRLLEKRRGVLDGVCITGGEPLMQKGIEEFISRIHAEGYCVKLDTNGCFPDKLEKILKTGNVDYVAMDIKNCREKYPLTVGIDNFNTAPVEKSVEILMNGNVDFEFRTTVVNELHSLDDMRRIGEWIQGAKRYFLQQFKDSGELINGFGLTAPDARQMQKMQKLMQWYVPDTRIRGVEN